MYMYYTFAKAQPVIAATANVPRQQINNNGYTRARMGMPFKPPTMSQGSMFSNARQIYIKDAGGGENWYSSSDVTALKRNNAIGKSSTKTGLANNAKLSYRSQDNNLKNSAIRRCRSGGCVAPKKKGAIANSYKGSGCS
jgi:hypothetical protein